MATGKSSKRRGRARSTTRRGVRVAAGQPTVKGDAAERDPAKLPATRGVARTSRERSEPTSVSTTADRLAEIDRSIEVLRKVVERLKGMRAAEVAALALADKQARAHTLSDANLAIEDLENAKLEVLNAAFESRRPELLRATSQLAADLEELQDTVAFIGAAASAVGIIADVVSVVS